MLRLLLGIALAPSAVVLVAASLRVLWSLSGTSPSVYPFLSGFALPVLSRLFLDLRSSWPGRMITRFYVLTHELTHALATWMEGGKVFGIKAGADGGHVDVSHASAFASLAPYCVPLLTVCVVLGYRGWVWMRGGSGGEAVFLFLMGVTLSFHLVATFECLWSSRQPDLDAAGGLVFSLAVIALANGLVFLVVLKALFPKSVALVEVLVRAFDETAGFWGWLGRGARSWWSASGASGRTP
ncbi:MAG: hypothetical protein HY748_12505 [Elusimicrobia bacterium]|nr:hypothetical protein [Elusimicrobiota bacterium]